MKDNKNRFIKVLSYVTLMLLALGFSYYFVFQSKNIYKTVFFVIAITALLIASSRKVIIEILKKDEVTWRIINIVAAIIMIPIWIYYAKDFIGLEGTLQSLTVSSGLIVYQIYKVAKMRKTA